MLDVAFHHPELLLSYLIAIVGETVEGHGTRLRRMAAKEILTLCNSFYCAQSYKDVLVLLVAIVDLKHRLANPSAHFPDELLTEEEPYSAVGISFSALVHLVRIEEGMLIWGWHPEQIRILGLAINPGEELAWPITRDLVSIMDREGNVRPFYRFCS